MLFHEGYSYVVTKKTSKKTVWICSKNTIFKCNCKVSQKKKNFSMINFHNHVAQTSDYERMQLNLELQDLAIKEENSSGKQIAEQILIKDKYKIEHLPSIETLKRTVNRIRETSRPKNPSNFDFNLLLNFIPKNFLLSDLRGKNERIIIFSTPKQLKILKRKKTWFVDGTFSVSNPPFLQLYCIHGFIKKQNNYKQVPLVFIFMSSKKRKSYTIAFSVSNNKIFFMII